MKRIISIVLAALMVAAMLVACGSSGPEGKYVVKTIDGIAVEEAVKTQAEAMGIDLDAFLKQMNIEKAEEMITIELKSDGTAVMAVNLASSTSEGTWKQDGDKISITLTGATGESETSDFTLSGNELTSQTGDQNYVFIKK